MSAFDALTVACEGWFDKPLCGLPDALRQRVEEEFLPMPWDRLSAAGRRSVTQQIDYHEDPAMEQVRQFCWDHSERRLFITTQIAQWEAVGTPTALDLAEKEKRLVELRQELASIAAEVFKEGGMIDYPRDTVKPTKRAAGIEHLPVLGDTPAVEKARGSTVRRDARKLDTADLHKQWQKAYREAKKVRPNMSDSWYSQQIAKLELARNRTAETIRKNMKS